MTENTSKKWYTSKTLWVNIVTLLISVLAVLIDSPLFPARIVIVITSIVLPILNMVLRFLTSSSIDPVIAKKVP